MLLFDLKIIHSFCFLVIVHNFSGIKAKDVENTFKHHRVVPDVIARSPNQFLKLVYESGEVPAGSEITPTLVKSQPLVEWQAEPDAFYTLIMSDPDAPSRAHPKVREFKHWLVGNIPGNDIARGDVLAAYVGAGPPQGTGLHRYVFLLYKQPAKLRFTEHPVANNSRDTRPYFHAAAFAKKYNLGQPLAGNFFYAQWDEYVTIVTQQLSGQ